MSINKVAELAGVSNATVSRVINNHPRVAADTVTLVRRAMRQLNYVPSDRRPGPKPMGRPSTGAGASVGFLVICRPGYQVAQGLFEQLLRGVSQAANEHRLNLLFSYITVDDTELPSSLHRQKLDGVLLHGKPLSPALSNRLRRLPAVWLLGNRRRPAWGDHVMPDMYALGSLAAEHLAGRGHKRFAFFNLDGGHWPFRFCRQTFRLAAEDRGIPVDVLERTSSESDQMACYSVPAVQELVDRYLALPDRPTGLLMADDQQTSVLQPALIRRGVSVGPGGVEVVSCNNEQPFLVALHPRPTAIDLRVESVGRRGVEQLLWRMNHADVPERIIAGVEPLLVPDIGAVQRGGVVGGI